MEVILFVVMLSVFIGYIASIWVKYGVQTSISKTYYVLPTNLNFLFTLFMWGYAFPAMILGLSLVGSGLMFFAAAFIMFVGAAAAFKEELTRTVHYVGAFGGIIFSQLTIFIDFNMWYLTVGFIIVSATILLIQKIYNINTTAWWIEIAAFITMVTAFANKMNLI